MKLLIMPPQDGKVHVYCFQCQREQVSFVDRMYRCGACGFRAGRALIIDPEVDWKIDVNREYWHKTAGVVVINERGEILFFEREKFPPGFNLPAGHVNKGEKPKAAAVRELFEETGIKATDLVTIGQDDIWGDACRRGAEVHRWFSFGLMVPNDVRVTIDASEGSQLLWLAREQALRRDDITFASRYVLENHARAIKAMAGNA